MTTHMQLPSSSPTGPAALAADLRRAVRGAVHVPGDPGFPAAVSPWNVAVRQHPAAVVVAADAADVRAVVRVAVATGMRVAPQGPGHGAGALDGLEDAILLRTSALADVSVDAAARTARVGGGALMGALVASAAGHGLAPVSGSTGGVSAVGFGLGGGIGWLSRALGLAASHVTALELVTAEGEAVRATADTEPDLFWALRGGGGGFGVVTAMELGLHEVASVLAGAMLWPIERAGELLPAWRDWTRGLPDTATTSLRLMRFPPFPDVPEPLRGRAWVVVDGAIMGDPSDAAALLAPLRALQPQLDTWAQAGPEVLPQVHMDPVDPTPALHGHALVRDADDRVLDGMLQLAGPGVETAMVFAELRHLGGALARRAPGGGAMDHVRGGYLLNGVGVPMGPGAEALPAQLAALESVGVHQSVGAYANFAEHHGPGEVHAPATLARLRVIKEAADPHDRFQAALGVR